MDCSTAALEAGEPLAGTAPIATSWILIEQRGPWGKEALLDSRLSGDLGQTLKIKVTGTGVNILLVRHPDRLARNPHDEDPFVWVAHTCPGATQMRRGTMSNLDAITDWDFAELAAGSLPPFGVTTNEPLFLVCTHSGRDACCALHGRALITDLHQSLSAAERESIWECSHIGGHRFAPTVMSLPGGAVYGRLTAAAALTVFVNSHALTLTLDNFRGRTCFAQPLQVAEITVRQSAAIYERDVLDVLRVIDGRALAMPPMAELPGLGSSLVAEVRHADGRAWRVNLRREELAQSRPKSCGQEHTTANIWRSTGVAQVAPWSAT
ncbi:MAG: sucrase ferredoxin [Actinomycetota bacterium]|nr:sucrase ferredoxin [Actinomycetota bacterium]